MSKNFLVLPASRESWLSVAVKTSALASSATSSSWYESPGHSNDVTSFFNMESVALLLSQSESSLTAPRASAISNRSSLSDNSRPAAAEVSSKSSSGGNTSSVLLPSWLEPRFSLEEGRSPTRFIKSIKVPISSLSWAARLDREVVESFSDGFILNLSPLAARTRSNKESRAAIEEADEFGLFCLRLLLLLLLFPKLFRIASLWPHIRRLDSWSFDSNLYVSRK